MSPILALRRLVVISSVLPVAALVFLVAGYFFAACGDDAAAHAFRLCGGLAGALAIAGAACLAIVHAAYASTLPTTYPPRPGC